MSERNAAKLNIKRSRSRSPVVSKVKSRRLLISNIPFSTTINDIIDLFKEKIGICGRLEFIEKNGKFSGNAIMDFKTLEGAQKAVDTMHKHEINGREIIVREETQKDRERLNLKKQANEIILPQIQSQSSLIELVNAIEREGSITNSVFVSNLDYKITWQAVKDMFKAVGRVLHVDLKTDAEGKSRGFGIVEFETPEEAILAIHLFNNQMVNNRELRLRMDKSGKALAGRLDMSKFVNNSNSASANNMNPQIKQLFQDIVVASSNPSRNNPQALKAIDELLNLAQMLDQPIGRHSQPIERNFGFPSRDSRGMNERLGNKSANDIFMSHQNYDLPPFNGRGSIINNKSMSGGNDFANNSREYPPRLKRDIDYNEGSRNMVFNSADKYPSNSGGVDMAAFEDMLLKMKNSGNLDPNLLVNAITNVMKRSPEPSHSLPNRSFTNQRSSNDFFSGRPTTTLLIKNIPFSYTWRDLQISFSQVTGIDQIEILRDDLNRSKGVAVVRFETYNDAMRCKNVMDGTLLDGRPIHIEVGNSV